MILNGHDEPHNIIPIPYVLKGTNINEYISNNYGHPTLIICEDELYEDLIGSIDVSNSVLGIVKISDISSNLLQIHWTKLAQHINTSTNNIEVCDDYSFIKLSTKSTQGILPLIPLANQFGYLKELFRNIDNYTNFNTINLNMHYRLISMAQQISKMDDQIAKRLINPLNENLNFQPSHLVITMPGIATKQSKYFNRSLNLPSIEKDIIEFIGYHRAIAKNALYIKLDKAPQELFDELLQLEVHCKGNNISNKYIWRTLRRIGKIINNKLKNSSVDILTESSQITIFSDFPIGLAILPGCSAPLCCITPIIYRPLTPLTKAFQYETIKENQIYFGLTCKILIIECIHKDDRIRKYCDILANNLVEM
ncbi:hypothetical protein [Lysinibacillus sp. NPDC047702]|uniref:hypothetical protein n=1 Tax=unclassified Lysinibacillus TaxID=2636778 RepID=UPI003D067C89